MHLTFLKIFLEDISPSCGPTGIPFWLLVTSVLGFKTRVDPPYLHAYSPVCNGFLRFTSSVTPADLLAAKLFSIQVFAHIQVLVRFVSRIEHAERRKTLYLMSYAGWENGHFFTPVTLDSNLEDLIFCLMSWTSRITHSRLKTAVRKAKKLSCFIRRI